MELKHEQKNYLPYNKGRIECLKIQYNLYKLNMAKKEKEKPVQMIRTVKVPFTEAEGNSMGHKISFLMQEKEGIEEERKSINDGFKNQIQAKETEINTLVRSMNLGFQMIQRNCEFVKNFDSGKREYWFNGEIVDLEPLTAADHQVELDLAAKNENGEKPDEENTATQELYLQSQTPGEPDKNKSDDDLTPVELTDDQKEQVIKFMELGDKDMKKKKYSDALTYYKAAQKMDPSNEEVNGKVQRIEEFLEKIAQSDKNKADLGIPVSKEKEPEGLATFAHHLEHGDHAFSKKKFQDAEKHYQICFDLFPDKPGIKEKLDSAKEYVDKMITAGALEPRDKWI